MTNITQFIEFQNKRSLMAETYYELVQFFNLHSECVKIVVIVVLVLTGWLIAFEMVKSTCHFVPLTIRRPSKDIFFIVFQEKIRNTFHHQTEETFQTILLGINRVLRKNPEGPTVFLMMVPQEAMSTAERLVNLLVYCILVAYQLPASQQHVRGVITDGSHYTGPEEEWPFFYQICGRSFNLSEFHLTSPGFPKRYAPGLKCSWALEASPLACGVALDIGDFILPPCPSDRLVVGDVQLCGALPKVVYLPLHRPRSNVTFSGNSDGGPGFNITIHQIKCNSQVVNQGPTRKESSEKANCGGVFFGDEVVITTPGYPYSYPPGANCRYTIRRSNSEVCQVEVTFVNSNLEVSEGCYKDRVEIQRERLCGELTGTRTYDMDDTLDVIFISDSEGSGKGVQLLARQIKCSETSIVIEAPVENDKQDVLIDCSPQGVQVSPPIADEGYLRTRRPFPPFYLPNEVPGNYLPSQKYIPQGRVHDNTPTQRVPLGLAPTQFSWKRPSSSTNPSNNNAPLQEYSPVSSRLPFNHGPVPHSPNLYNTVYSPSNPFQPTYTRQFSQIHQCCSQIYTEGHFLIVSPGFPRSQMSDCIYTIQRCSPLTSQLRFQFRYFWVGQDSGSGCSGGALEIDGRRICGCRTGMIWTSQFYNSEAVKVLHLRLDSSVDRLFSGFVIEVYQDDSYSGRFKRGENNPSSERFTLSNGSIVNFTQYVETFVEREPLILENNGNQLVDGTNSQLLWDSNLQTWTLPTDIFCIRWSFQDWLLLTKEALWNQYQCPASASSNFVIPVDSSRYDITACRTCYYFCRENCQCC